MKLKLCYSFYMNKDLYELSYSAKKDFNKKNNQKSRENAHRALKAIMHMAKLSGAKENKQIF